MPNHSTRTLAIISVMLCMGACLRWIDIGTESLWTDELYSLHWSGKHVGQILANAAADVHPPTYYILLHWWTQCFGTSESALRGLSALLGMLTLPLMYLLGNALLGARGGLAAAWMLALSHMHVYYCQEARNYTLVVLCTVWSMYAFWSVLKRILEYAHALPWRTEHSDTALALHYILATIVLMHTHLFALFVVMAQNAAVLVLVVHGLWRNRKATAEQSRVRYVFLFTRWMVMQMALLVLFLPWLNILVRQILSVGKQGFWIEEPTALTLAETFAEYAGGYWLLMIMGALALWGIYRLWTGTNSNTESLINALSDTSTHQALPQEFSQKFSQELSQELLRELRVLRAWTLLLWLAFPIGIPLVKSLLSAPSIYYIKYTIPSLPAFLLLVAAGWSLVSSRAVRWCVVVSILLLSLQAVQEEWNVLNKERWREAALMIDSLAAPNDGIIVHQWYYTWALEYYCRKPHHLQGVPSQYLQWKPDIIEHLVNSASQGRNRVWLVMAQRDARFPMMTDALARQGFRQNTAFGTTVIPSFYRKYFVRDEYDTGQIVLSLLKTYQTPYIRLLCFERTPSTTKTTNTTNAINTPAHTAPSAY